MEHVALQTGHYTTPASSATRGPAGRDARFASNSTPQGTLLRMAHAGANTLALPQPSASEQAQQALVRALEQRDREVRAHEQAHKAAAGGLVRGTGFSYQYGPDGRAYAVGGEVSLDTAPVPNDPEATLEKAQQIRAAALAPINPSSQDRRIALQASRMAAQARMEIARAEGQESNPLQSQRERDAGVQRYADVGRMGLAGVTPGISLAA